MNEDLQYLKLLSIFHYVVGGLIALFSCFPIIHLVIGIILVVAPGTMEEQGEEMSPFIGWFFIVFATFFIVLGWTLAVCVMVAGRFLSRREHYVFCLAMGGIVCVFMPFGTVLGVFTIIVLVRPSVKALFSPEQVAAHTWER